MHRIVLTEVYKTYLSISLHSQIRVGTNHHHLGKKNALLNPQPTLRQNSGLNARHETGLCAVKIWVHCWAKRSKTAPHKTLPCSPVIHNLRPISESVTYNNLYSLITINFIKGEYSKVSYQMTT